MAAANIQECLGVDKARAQQIAEKSLRRFGRMVVEVMRFPLLNKDNITKLVNVEGLEYLEEAYKQNKGVIIATGHFGNWELLGATIALHGYPMNIVKWWDKRLPIIVANMVCLLSAEY